MNRKGCRNSRSSITAGVRAGYGSDISHYQERFIYYGLQYSVSISFALRRVQFSTLGDLNRTDNVPLRLSLAHF